MSRNRKCLKVKILSDLNDLALRNLSRTRRVQLCSSPQLVPLYQFNDKYVSTDQISDDVSFKNILITDPPSEWTKIDLKLDIGAIVDWQYGPKTLLKCEVLSLEVLDTVPGPAEGTFNAYIN